MENIRKRHVWACTYFDFPSNRKLSFCLCEKFLYQLTKWVENKGRSRHFSLAKMTSHVPGSCQKGITGCCWKPLQRNNGTIHTCKTHCSLRSLLCWVSPRGEQGETVIWAHHGELSLMGKTLDFAAFTVQQYQLTDQSFVPLPVLLVALYTRH